MRVGPSWAPSLRTSHAPAGWPGGPPVVTWPQLRASWRAAPSLAGPPEKSEATAPPGRIYSPVMGFHAHVDSEKQKRSGRIG